MKIIEKTIEFLKKYVPIFIKFIKKVIIKFSKFVELFFLDIELKRLYKVFGIQAFNVLEIEESVSRESKEISEYFKMIKEKKINITDKKNNLKTE